jgi:GNAT superfamily N-acetyltransferase
VVLRSYEPADLEPTVRMWHDTKRQAFPYNVVQQEHTIEDDTRFFREVLVREYELWLAATPARILGLLALQGELVGQLFVATSAQRRGIGTLLLHAAMERSPAGLRLYTFQRNAAARAFYEKHGLLAVAFAVSPPPESEPDVEYHWRP